MKTSRLAATASTCGVSCPRARECRPHFSTHFSFIRLLQFVWFACVSLSATVSALTIGWNASPEAGVAGYRLSYGTESGSHPEIVEAGMETSAEVSGLQAGTTYYFVVRVLNEDGLQSLPSPELAYQMPEDPGNPVTVVPRDAWTLHYVDSEDTAGYAATRAFDGDTNTFWHSEWRTGGTDLPHEIQIDLGAVHPVAGFRYLPRQDNFTVGDISQYEFHVSLDGENWGAPVASGNFAASKTEKEVRFTAANARYVLLRSLAEVNGNNDCNVAELTILRAGDGITPPTNSAPVASPRSLVTEEDQQLAITLVASDPDGDPLSYVIVTGPVHGSLSGTTPDLTYSPAPGFSGADSFTFKVNDGNLDSATATVSLTVTPQNDPPVALARSVSTAEDSSVSITLGSTDPDGDPITYAIVTNPAKGTVTGTPPNLTYSPNPDFHGSDSFTYRAHDGTVPSNVATVSITVTPVNDAPLAASKSATTAKNTPVSMGVSATDKDGDPLSYAIVTAPAHGTLSGSAPNFTYTPVTGYTGPDAFTFKAHDGTVDSNTASVSILVAASDPSGLVSRAGWILHHVDSEDSGNYTALKSFDDDPSTFWHTRFKSDATPPPHEIQINLGGVQSVTGFRYLPRQDALNVGNIGKFEFYLSMDGRNWGSPVATGTFANTSAEKEITFTAREARYLRLRAMDEVNGGTHSNIAELNLLGSAVANRAPVAKAASLSTPQAKPLSLVLASTDADADPLTHSIVTQPAKGTLGGSPPNLVYTPGSGFTGSDSFTFQAHDGKLASNIATVSINVTPGETAPENEAPVFTMASIQGAAGTEGTAYTGESIAGSATDGDPGDRITYSKTSGPEWLSIWKSGRLVGKPPLGAGGINRFTVRATDKSGAWSETELVLEIEPGALPLPWKQKRLGGGGRLDQESSLSGVYLLTGAGRLARTHDAGNYIWQTLSGDGEIITRVTGFDDADATSRAGVMIRESLAGNSRHVFLGVDGSSRLNFMQRARTGGATSTRTKGAASANTWLRLVRAGHVISAYKSANGKNWIPIGSTRMALRQHCYIGLCVGGGDGNYSTGRFYRAIVKP